MICRWAPMSVIFDRYWDSAAEVELAGCMNVKTWYYYKNNMIIQ